MSSRQWQTHGTDMPLNALPTSTFRDLQSRTSPKGRTTLTPTAIKGRSEVPLELLPPDAASERRPAIRGWTRRAVASVVAGSTHVRFEGSRITVVTAPPL